MRSILRLSAVAMLLVAGTAMAMESGMREEIADLRAKVAALETTQMAPAAGGDCQSLTSMKKRGMITIGGDVETAIIVANMDDRATVDGGQDDEVDSTNFTTTDADLNFKVAANACMGLVLKLDVDDAWDAPDGAGIDQDDFLEEVYFYFKNVMQSPWGINFGKKEVPFGQDKDLLILPGLFNTSGHFIAYNQMLKDYSAEPNVGGATPHMTPDGLTFWPVEQDNRFMVESTYAYKDLLTLEMAVFQDSRGMHEDRMDDHLLMESYAMRVKVMPLEGLTLQASYMNQHNDSGDDDTIEHNGISKIENGNDNVKSLSLGVDYKLKSLPLELFAEYAYGWDGMNNEEYDCHALQIGGAYGVTEAVDLIMTGNWVDIDQDDNVGATDTERDNDLYSVQIGVQYKLEQNITLSMEYQHDWYDFDVDGADDYDQNADALAFGIKWNF